MELAVATGIAPAAWAEEDERTIRTAIELLAAKSDNAKTVIAG